MTIRTRFSPSPTGMIHLGNARAALFSALFAKKQQGTFVLRIEDTDLTRSHEMHVKSLEADLKWLTIHWQEGPEVGGPYAPYFQSQRGMIYVDYYQRLEEKALIYPCFCSEQELAVVRKLQLSRGEPPRYNGKCYTLSKEEIASHQAAGTKPTWRFHVPKNKQIQFTDFVKGLQVFNSDDIGDFIIRRADGTAPFLFCNAIDDAVMKVTHVLRGDDHLANTPRQMMLLDALSLKAPQYGHMPLILGDDGAPLSKRHGSFSIHEMRETGYLSIAIINYLARLSHTLDSQVLLPFDELAQYFNLERLSRAAARFDLAQLNYWQNIAVKRLSEEAFLAWMGKEIECQIPENKKALFIATIADNVTFPADVKQWVSAFFATDLSFDHEQLMILNEATPAFFEVAISAIRTHGVDFESVMATLKTTLNVSGKKLFLPLRLALTGTVHGPHLNQIATLLGEELMLKRLAFAGELVKEAGSHA